MISVYYDGQSFLHKLPAWFKLLLLFFITTLMFVIPNMSLVLGLLVSITLLYYFSSLPYSQLRKLIKVSFLLLLMIFCFNAYTHGFMLALVIVLRLFVVILFSSMISLTTRMTEMMDVITNILTPLSCFGINVSKISLCMLLTIRFIPMLYEIAHQVREAQCSRGVEHHPFALIIPICIRVFKQADELTQALDARGFESISSNKKNR
ncbi:energy-coupling factor transporter transmembrane component T family protein [Thorsellia kenyensis]|uniref:Energy-coupling factor transporter transmembrane component T family protein n=1 Tax=Thorsellia kenyensis TaxID=1549888 RepID=A0ABV6CBZ0_9GAMM